jgi:hypothetical protein
LRYVADLRAAFIVVMVAVVLCGCGTVGSHAAPLPSATPSTGPGLGFDVAVTEQTRAVTLRVGEKLEVVLHARPGMTTWKGVESSDTSVLKPVVNPAATAARGITMAAFQAIVPGKARITASAGPLCSPGQACPAYVMVLTIDVTVIA